jgi:hypothetical protein
MQFINLNLILFLLLEGEVNRFRSTRCIYTIQVAPGDSSLMNIELIIYL